jgi:hypothetical protein
MNYKLEKIRKEAVVAYSRIIARHMEDKAKRNLSQVMRCPNLIRNGHFPHDDNVDMVL